MLVHDVMTADTVVSTASTIVSNGFLFIFLFYSIIIRK